ncbi:MAG TPA: ABC transporter permease [Kiloniellales bacterium]|jgi:ribose transport system permease protein
MTALRVLFADIDRPVLLAFACIILLLLGGSLYTPNFLSPDYLLKQLQLGAFLGVIASGVMLVILLGHIDLSIPWVLTSAAMISTAVAGWWGDAGAAMAIPLGVLWGVVFGVINGLGVAYLRVPSMIFTLGVNAVLQGMMVMLTGGAAPQSYATDAMRELGAGATFGVPHSLLVWAVVGALVLFLLKRTAFGRYIFAFGNSETATYLSGVNTKLVIVGCFAIAGGCSALAGVLLAGYGTKAAQAMGDPYLLPAIASVVLGGTYILGGRGTYLGTVAGVILITLLQSILRIVQLPDSWRVVFEAPESLREIAYGVVIIGMMLLYGREKAFSK